MILVLFYLSNYDNPDVIEFTNNGTTEAISLVQFHFHWGENDYQVKFYKKKDFLQTDYFKGSEHHINDKKYSGEIHLYYASNRTNITDVVAFLLKVFKFMLFNLT
jgi:hypothetical protein